MLTRVYIDNFRSFSNFEYFPGKKQLLMGVNGSGKSSLLEALRKLKGFVKGDANPFTQSTRTRWLDKPAQVFELEASIDGGKFSYRLELGFAAVTKAQEVKRESLSVNGSLVFELAGGLVFFFLDGSQKVAVPLLTNRSALHLAELSNRNVQQFIGWLDRVHCFDIDAYPGEMEDVSDNEEYEPDFELRNLAGWYRSLVQTHPFDNVKFTNSLKESMDGFMALAVSVEEDGGRRLRAQFASPAKQWVPYSISELSTGQRYLIALYMILHFLIARGHTVFIDEPDNFIALHEIQPWLLAAEDEVDEGGGQLIIVSHHPETLNQWAKDYGLKFFREDNGHVRTQAFSEGTNYGLEPSEVVARGWE